MNQTQILPQYLTAVAQAPVLAGLEVSLMTVRQPDGTLTSTGAPDGSYIDVAGLVAVQCMDAPESLGSGVSSTEASAMSQIESMSLRHVLLSGYYSQLSPETNWGDAGWIAVVTNQTTGQVQTYDIRGAEADSQGTQTHLCLRKVTV